MKKLNDESIFYASFVVLAMLVIIATFMALDAIQIADR